MILKLIIIKETIKTKREREDVQEWNSVRLNVGYELSLCVYSYVQYSLICVSVSLCMRVSVCTVCVFVCVCLSVCFFVYVGVCLYGCVYLCVYLCSICVKCVYVC